MLPKLENKTQAGATVYIVLLIINCSTHVHNIYTLYSVQQNKAYARLNLARQQSSCSAAVWHGTEHVQTRTVQYPTSTVQTVSTNLYAFYFEKSC